jgi:hypothetical protein
VKTHIHQSPPTHRSKQASTPRPGVALARLPEPGEETGEPLPYLHQMESAFGRPGDRPGRWEHSGARAQLGEHAGAVAALVPPAYGIAVADSRRDMTAAELPPEQRRQAPTLTGRLLIGAADDPAEAAADRLAGRALSLPPPSLPGSAAPGGGDAPSSVHAVLRAPGRPLDAATRAVFEPRFGLSLRGVRVHDDGAAAASARDVGALAYTAGPDIVFGAGRYAPHTDAGRQLLAHEIAHVAQAGATAAAPTHIRRQPAPGQGGIAGQLPGDDWRVLGAQAAVVSDEDLVTYLTRSGGLDAAVIKASTVMTESTVGPDTNRVFRHPTKGEVARVLIRRITSGGTISHYVFLYSPKAGGGRAAASPPGQGTPSAPPPGPGKTTAAPAPGPTTTTGTPIAATPPAPLPPLSLPELQARLNLLDAAINRTKAKYKLDPQRPEPALFDAAFANVKAMRQALTGSPADVERITDAERIVERIDRALDLINDKLIDMRKAPGIEESLSGYLEQFAGVQLAYFQALSKILTADQVAAFNDAENKAARLPRALIEADLKRYETRKPTYDFMEWSRTEIVDWVGSVRQELDALEKLTADLQTARASNSATVASLETAVNAKAELIQLSIEAIGHWDRVRSAYKYLADERNLIYTAYRSIGRLVQRCAKMKAAAKAGQLDDLRARVKAYREDPDVAEFYKGLPIIAFGSRFLVSLAIALVATLVTAGVGGLIAGGATTGAAATGAAATGFTARTALAFAGTAALEALTFTAVSTALNYAILGQKVTPGGVARDLLWNIGLFGALKGLTIGVGKAMVALDVPALAGPAALAGSMPLLHYFGRLRFRLEEGRWMTDAEAATATAEMIIMAAGLAVGTATMKRWLQSNRGATELAKFERDYGFRFTEIEAGRQRLINEVAELIAQNKADDKAAMDKIRERAAKLEDIAKQVVKEIESKVNLTKLRTELAQAGRALETEGSAEALAKVIGVDIDTGLKRAGGERTFTYAWGKTKQLEIRLRALKATVDKTSDSATGLRRVTAQFGEEPLITFQERADPVFGETEVEVNPSDPAITKFIGGLGLKDPAAIRTVVTMITAQLARSPKNGLNFAIGQVRAELKTRLKTTPGAIMESLVLEARKAGVAASGAPAPLVAEAAKQVTGGLLDDPVWKEKRTLPDFLGVLAERLARGVVPTPKAPGGRVLSNVNFIGDQFTDAVGTKPRTTSDGKAVVDTTVSELDFMGLSGTGADAVVESMANVKAGPGRGGAAAVQNQNALNALKGAISGNLVPIKDGANTYYARVKKVTAVDPSGAAIDLTGKLKEASGGVKAETIGPKAARGYDRPLPYTEKELRVIVELLREMQMKRSPDY